MLEIMFIYFFYFSVFSEFIQDSFFLLSKTFLTNEDLK